MRVGKKGGAPKMSRAQYNARIRVCREVSERGGKLKEAVAILGTVSYGGLYKMLREYDYVLLRQLCRRRGGNGKHLQVSPEESQKRYDLIHRYGWTKAAQMLGFPKRSGAQGLYGWYRYRKKIGLI